MPVKYIIKETFPLQEFGKAPIVNEPNRQNTE